jgi:hypothetical protein
MCRALSPEERPSAEVLVEWLEADMVEDEEELNKPCFFTGVFFEKEVSVESSAPAEPIACTRGSPSTSSTSEEQDEVRRESHKAASPSYRDCHAAQYSYGLTSYAATPTRRALRLPPFVETSDSDDLSKKIGKGTYGEVFKVSRHI